MKKNIKKMESPLFFLKKHFFKTIQWFERFILQWHLDFFYETYTKL